MQKQGHAQCNILIIVQQSQAVQSFANCTAISYFLFSIHFITFLVIFVTFSVKLTTKIVTFRTVAVNKSVPDVNRGTKFDRNLHAYFLADCELTGAVNLAATMPATLVNYRLTAALNYSRACNGIRAYRHRQASNH
jgi:hypothetical protein